jgi:hypothetical protein
LTCAFYAHTTASHQPKGLSHGTRLFRRRHHHWTDVYDLPGHLGGNPMNTYSIWQDWFSKQYEVVRWVDQENFVSIQTNIRTYEKAQQALTDWKKREEEKSK